MHIVKRRWLTTIQCILFAFSVGNAVGCVGSPVHSTLKYGFVQRAIKRNNNNLMELKAGMSKEQVRSIMRDPERSEGYPWGSAWLYRTAITKGISGGIYGTVDSDYTPAVFNDEGNLVGWGRNFLVERTKRYEITIKEGSPSK